MVVRLSNWRALVVGALLSIVFVALVLAQANLREALNHLQQINLRRVALPVLLAVTALSIRAFRWQIIFPPAARPPLWRSVNVWMVATMSNNLLPARGGDLLRCFLISQDGATAMTTALATLAFEKVLDGLALLAVVVVSFAVIAPPDWLRHIAVLATVTFGGALLATIAIGLRPKSSRALLLSWLGWMHQPRIAETLARVVDNVASGLSAIRSARHLIVLAVMTGLAWFSEVLLVWAMAGAFHQSLTIGGASLVAAVIGLGLMVPAAPGYLGSYEFFSVSALKIFGIAAESALALTLAMHATILIVTTGLGLTGLTATGLSFSRLIAVRRIARAEGASGGPSVSEASPGSDFTEADDDGKALAEQRGTRL